MVLSASFYLQDNFAELVSTFHMRQRILYTFKRKRLIDYRSQLSAFHEIEHGKKFIAGAHRGSEDGDLFPVEQTRRQL
jgi:hypothetical protein